MGLISHNTLVGVAECPSSSVQQILQRDVACQCSDVHFKVQRDVFATVVKWCDGTTDLIEARLEILLLPFPKDAVNVAMMKVEEGVCFVSVTEDKHA
jgi:hypothetical protein